MAGSGSDVRLDVQTLASVASGVLIVAHDEDTTLLRATLESEGFLVEEVRGPYSPEQMAYSAIMRCMVNHANAWRIAASRCRPTIVVEADFVPVRGFGSLPVPVPSALYDASLAYLYSVGPQIWDLAAPGVARGHGGGMVALLIPQKVAEHLLLFYQEELERNPLGRYSPFDTRVGYWLKDRGIQSYIPYRHYGEHGGVGNPEHARVGFSRSHRADAFLGKLAFAPFYAGGSKARYLMTRIRARFWGGLRLLCGRLLSWHDFARSDRFEMLRFALGRLLTSRAPRQGNTV